MELKSAIWRMLINLALATINLAISTYCNLGGSVSRQNLFQTYLFIYSHKLYMCAYTNCSVLSVNLSKLADHIQFKIKQALSTRAVRLHRLCN